MFDINELNQSSFRGVPFYTRDTELSSGKRLTDHNFINGGTKTEDNGLKNKTFKIAAYIGGDDYLNQKAALVQAFDTLGSGTLIDKFYGTLEVEVDTYVIKESISKFGLAEISITFKKADNEAIVEDLIIFNVNYRDEFAANFENDFDNNIGSELLNQIANGIADIWGAVLDAIKFIEDIRDDLNKLKGQIGAAISNIKTTILSVQSLSQEISNILTSFDDILDFDLFGVEDQKSFTNSLREILQNTLVETSTNTALSTSERQIKTYTTTVISGITQTAINNLENIEFSTGDNFGSIKDDILTIYELLEEDIEIADDDNITTIEIKQNLLNKMHSARSEFVFYYTQKYSSLQPLQDETIGLTTDVLTLTMEKYGDISRVSEVLINNDIVDPLFISGDIKLLDR